MGFWPLPPGPGVFNGVPQNDAGAGQPQGTWPLPPGPGVTNGVPNKPFDMKVVVAIGGLWAVLAFMSDSDTYGDLAAALSGAIAVSVAVKFGKQFSTEVKRMVS